MSNWNRIGNSDAYTVTLVGTEEEWLQKKKEILSRNQTIVREGWTLSAFGSKRKYWARVSREKK